MKSVLNRILVVPVVAGVLSLVAGSASAQFAKPVVVMKGAVQTNDGKPAVVRLSIHETGDSQADEDTSSDVITCAIQEITASKANSESGRYLLILKPGKKYWIHIEGAFIQSIDSLIATPKTEKPLQLERNFTVLWRGAPQGGTAQDASPAKKD
jgi:hypothetical protein